ncbi:MAG: preprotein translocase subunit SecG [Flaviaesturariibacter sp.]|nr:preprotein translocase subunit SecG [Flaviaesturariibacter sp.]
MTTLFIILIILACIILSLVVLVQNPKGGGLAGNVAGFSNQFMGVKQTTDVLEKGTWIFAGVIAILCITSSFFISDTRKSKTDLDAIGTGAVPGSSKPARNTAPFSAGQPATNATPDSTKR